MRRCKVSLTQIDFYTKRSWKVKAEIYSISNRNGDRNGVLNGKTAVVTGAQGIGKEIARVYAKLGAKVLISDVNEEKLQNDT